MKKTWVLLMAIVVVVAVLMFWIDGLGTANPASSGSVSAPTAAAMVRVTYSASGSAGKVALTYTDDTGADATAAVSLPWQSTVTLPAGTYVFFSVDNQDDSGDVACTIDVDGKAWRESQAAGGFGVALCGGTLGGR
jgi:hypothetical protein